LSESPGPVVIAGGGIGGLFAALALGRLGYPVTLVERDEFEEADGVEGAFGVERRGAPQMHQTHGFLARLTNELRTRFPDVLDALLAAGAQTMTPRALRAADDLGDLRVLTVRRSTFEWVLRSAVLAEPSVDLIQGAGVVGLMGEATGGSPRVRGARLDDGREISGTVVACTGRHGDVPAWLGALGVEVAETVQDTHHLYLTRWYRFADGVGGLADPRLGGDFGFLKFLAVPADGGTCSVTLAVRSSDIELRRALLQPHYFDRVLTMLPGPDSLFAGGSMEPIGTVRPMGGLINRLRRFTEPAGQPLVQGFHAVGDAHTCTNPLYGRGCALALVQAILLADAFAEFPDDELGRARAYEAGSAREVEPWHSLAVLMDRPVTPGTDRRAEMQGLLKLGDILADVMLGGEVDPVVARGLLEMINVVVRPDQLLADTEFVTRIASLLNEPRSEDHRQRLLRPSRDEILEAVAA
jgi:2-polyprenyl-6-methoxyphenol hydroxylase-like FAD-dependent oxidoreductase